MDELRVLYEVSRAKSEDGTKNYCLSCALEPTTDSWKGFVCHSNQPAWRENQVNTGKDLIVCRGFERLRSTCSAESLKIAKQAMAKIKKVVGR